MSITRWCKVIGNEMLILSIGYASGMNNGAFISIHSIEERQQSRLFTMQFYANQISYAKLLHSDNRNQQQQQQQREDVWFWNWDWCMLNGSINGKGNENGKEAFITSIANPEANSVSIVIYSHILTWYLNYDDICMKIHSFVCFVCFFFALKFRSATQLTNENLLFGKWSNGTCTVNDITQNIDAKVLSKQIKRMNERIFLT